MVSVTDVEKGDVIETTIGYYTHNPTRVTVSVTEIVPPKNHDADIDGPVARMKVLDILDNEADTIVKPGDRYIGRFADDAKQLNDDPE